MYIFDKIIQIAGICAISSFICFWILAFATQLSGELKNFDDAKDLFKNKIIKTVVLATIVSFIVLTLGGRIFNLTLKTNLEDTFHSFNTKTDKLYIDNKLIKNAEEIITEVFTSRHVAFNRSSPGKEIKIKAIINNTELLIIAARDSKDQSAYWIFYSKYKTSRENEVWKTRTTVLSNY